MGQSITYLFIQWEGTPEDDTEGAQTDQWEDLHTLSAGAKASHFLHQVVGTIIEDRHVGLQNIEMEAWCQETPVSAIS